MVPPRRPRLQQPAPRGSGGGRCAFFLLLLLGPCVATLLLPLLIHPGHGGSNRTKCMNNLRQLALAAIQYADDKRGLPTLPGGYDTNASTRTTRALLWQGYHDNPEDWICPSSYDLFVPVADRGVNEDLRRWFWNGEYERIDPQRNPLAGEAPDPALTDTIELSYGWFHRQGAAWTPGLPLAADRSLRNDDLDMDTQVDDGELGNHPDRFHVVYGDASIRTHAVDPPEDGRVTYLELLPPQILRATPTAPTDWRRARQQAISAGGPALWFALLGLTAWWGWFRPQPAVKTALRERKRFLTADVDGVGPSPLGDTRTNDQGKPVLTLSPGQRCPYCHDGLTPEDDVVACKVCRTPMHRACAVEGETCSSLGCKNQRPA